MRGPFETLDISGDAGIRAFGKSLEESFANAALGMYSLITDLETVLENKEIEIEVKSDSPEGLLVSWLNELIFRFDTYGFVGKKIRVSTLDDYRIKAYVSGEDFDEERHERGLLVKAATYHRLKVERGDGIWVVEVIFDI